MIPVPMKAPGWFRTTGTKTSAYRVYEELGDLDNPNTSPRRVVINTHYIMGERTSGGQNQWFNKGTSNYDFIKNQWQSMGWVD